jgi:hypothetical protein
MLRSIVICVALVATCAIAVAQGLPASSVWKNQRGSELTVTTVDPTGRFSGTYVNRAPGFACQNEPFDVSGHAWSRRVVFTVVWKNASQDCRSTTTWFGVTSSKTMQTTWQLSAINPKTRRPRVSWGRDRFDRVK